MKLPELNWPAVAYLWAACIWLGSIAHTAFRVLCGDSVTAAGAVLQIIVASFAGLLAGLIGMRCNCTAETIMIVCGVAGWSGSGFVRIVELRVLHGIQGK